MAHAAFLVAPCWTATQMYSAYLSVPLSTRDRGQGLERRAGGLFVQPIDDDPPPWLLKNPQIGAAGL